MNTKDLLYKLFEYQKFEKDPHLESIIDSALDSDALELNDEVLLAAAGGNENKKELCVGDSVSVAGRLGKFTIVAIQGANILVESDNKEGQETIQRDLIV